MTTLRISDLRASVAGNEVLKGVNLEVRSGEIHAIMGPNGSGKSTLSNVLFGKSVYEVTGGAVELDGRDLLHLPTHERAALGLYLIAQDPMEIPGVPLRSVLREALVAQGRSEEATAASLDACMEREAEEIGIMRAMLDRAVNVDASGGEKKRLETLQLAILQPKIAILDELDSGLDVDALREVARRVERQAHGRGPKPLGLVAITHYRRLLDALHPDAVHIFVDGAIVRSGGLELADELERDGYSAYVQNEPDPLSLFT